MCDLHPTVRASNLRLFQRWTVSKFDPCRVGMSFGPLPGALPPSISFQPCGLVCEEARNSKKSKPLECRKPEPTVQENDITRRLRRKCPNGQIGDRQPYSESGATRDTPKTKTPAKAAGGMDQWA